MAVKIKRPENELLMELYDHGPRETGGATVRQRRSAAGKKPVKSTDRRRRGDARSKQYNTNVTQELWDVVERLLSVHDLTKAEFTERAIRHYAEHLKKFGVGDNA
jgi:hypothetical protein